MNTIILLMNYGIITSRGPVRPYIAHERTAQTLYTLVPISCYNYYLIHMPLCCL